MPLRRTAALLAALLLVLLGSGACGSDDEGAESAATSTTSAPATSGGAEGSVEGPGAGSSTTSGTTDATGGSADPGATSASSAPATTEPAPPTAAPGDVGPREAEGDGQGTAALVGVRTGRQEGADRIVFELADEIRPGYLVRWIDGPVTEDGSGNPVEVDGPAYLMIILRPASGYDLEAGAPTYTGPTRLAAPGGGVANEVVSTGDFEAQVTWVVGADEQVPFTVSTLDSPSRVVVDLQTG